MIKCKYGFWKRLDIFIILNIFPALLYSFKNIFSFKGKQFLNAASSGTDIKVNLGQRFGDLHNDC